MLSVVEAQQILLNNFSPLEEILVPLEKSAYKVLSKNVVAEVDLPSFSNSSMDGFAVKVGDIEKATHENPVCLDVIADIPAGKISDVVISSGLAARIMTGGMLPMGAEAVVPMEDTNINRPQATSDLPEKVFVQRSLRAGEYIRPKGQDVRVGETVIEKGRRMRAQEIGLCAMLGQAAVYIHRPPKVAIISTGDELISLGTPMTPGKIFDSNSYTLVAQIQEAGGDAIYYGIIPDQADALERSLDRAVVEGVDLILSTAGVSVGAFDFMREVIHKHGQLEFWKVDIRPGKPLAFGKYREKPVICLPGNPVSAFVGFEVFVRPVLSKMTGLNRTMRPDQKVSLEETIETDGRESYFRGRVFERNGDLVARLVGHQGSGNLKSLVQANALLIVPSGVKSLPIGSKINAWIFDNEI